MFEMTPGTPRRMVSVMKRSMRACDVTTPEMIGNDSVRSGDEGLVGTLAALDARFLANSADPLVGARGSIPSLRFFGL